MSWRKPLIGVVVDAAMGYGRTVLQGVMQYANIRRSWLFQEDLRARGGKLDHWHKCDGAILAVATPTVLSQVRQHTRHIVSCSGSLDLPRIPTVCVDDVAVGRLAAEHLLDCQIENFAFYTTVPSRLSERRSQGFRETLAARGFGCSEPQFVRVDPMDLVDRGHWPKVTRWLQELPKPVGIMATDDALARELSAICFKAEIEVPDRVAILGVNNDDLLCNINWPPLSSIDMDFRRVGYRAAELLDRLLSGEKLAPEQFRDFVPPVGVIKRASTNVLAIEDVNLAEALRFIREHACDPCTVHDVLRQVPVGRRWLERQFVRQLGRSPHAEILRVQMESARRLLLHSKCNLSEVAEQCGFSAPQSFSRAFRQAMGDSPAAYRRANALTEALPTIAPFEGKLRKATSGVIADSYT
jgi:LacI family transcriptional regulator